MTKSRDESNVSNGLSRCAIMLGLSHSTTPLPTRNTNLLHPFTSQSMMIFVETESASFLENAFSICIMVVLKSGPMVNSSITGCCIEERSSMAPSDLECSSCLSSRRDWRPGRSFDPALILGILSALEVPRSLEPAKSLAPRRSKFSPSMSPGYTHRTNSCASISPEPSLSMTSNSSWASLSEKRASGRNLARKVLNSPLSSSPFPLVSTLLK
mmetsp:Transcript_72617/g.205868  ORF Transcript_72617/g.205868 Transcript_72617/m.205868 type:complete len:213 (+) Transcript_72617:133-771(+)